MEKNISITIFSVKENLPQNYEDVIAIGDGISISAQYINGVFETSNDELYGMLDGEMEGADSFIVTHWMKNDFHRLVDK